MTGSSPRSLEEIAEETLQTALDIGIDEESYWEMTMAEVSRRVDSYNRCEERKRQEKAMFDYTLADLIGASVARIMSSDVEFPSIYQVYPDVFKEEQTAPQEDPSVARFLQYAAMHNLKQMQSRTESGKGANTP